MIITVKKFVLIPIIVGLLGVYFSMTVFILPEHYSSKEQFVPVPYVEAELSATEVRLGESFQLSIYSENRGDYGDIHILSTSFPTVQNIEDVVEIVSYDFTHAPKYVVPGDEIGYKYSAGLEKIHSKYPSIEAMSRPAPPGSQFHMDLVITPGDVGPFSVYVKSIDIPHTSQLSHYPTSGQLDHQDEYVLVYSVNVNP